jgi:fatty-acyl-CoA synthase
LNNIARSGINLCPLYYKAYMIMTHSNIYDTNLPQTSANHEPLSPISFLRRAAEVYPDRVAVVHGEQRFKYRELYARCRQLASALVARGITAGDTVAILAPNIPAHLEAHYGVPMTGAVLNAINTRLDAAAIAFILEHGEAKVLMVDPELSDVARTALAECEHEIFVIDIDDVLAPQADPIGEITYESFLKTGDPSYTPPSIADEWQAIALGLHVWNDRKPKRCCDSPSWRIHERHWKYDGVGHDTTARVSVDLAHVSLQRLVFSLDDHSHVRHPCMFA